MNPPFVVLQLSDLHRTRDDPVTNAELLAALEADRGRWPEGVSGQPDFVVVSGDLVQGVALGTADASEQLEKQYLDAGALLAQLVERFLGGDRSRLVFVPGNHDVDWCTARSAMDEVGDEELLRVERALPATTLDPASPYRWNWRERRLYKVVNAGLYASRCTRFLDFRREFYSAVSPDPLRLGDTIVFVEAPSLDVSITGLSSWHGNDCFCHVGAFDPEDLLVARDAIAASPCGLHIAVWHHGIVGKPAETDFLEGRIVHRLVDYGFRVGLHRHHHRSDATVMPLRLPTKEEFALVSAGSLAAGSRELPAGVERQYTLLRFESDARRLRVHVREAISGLVFVARHAAGVRWQ